MLNISKQIVQNVLYNIFARKRTTKMKGKYTASDIAKWFLLHNKVYYDEGSADLISNLKLQKLLYYAQGTYLAIKNELLFPENIIAWQYGPVVKDVYQEYRQFGCKGIELEIYEIPKIDNETALILEQVYDVFGQYSAIGLMNKTHNETPWKETLINEVINTESIKNYFVENYIE